MRLLLLLHPVTALVAAAQVWSRQEQAAAVVRPLTRLALAFLIHRFLRRTPWPSPFRLRFAAMHAAAAVVVALAWLVASWTLVSLVLWRRSLEWRWEESLFIGVLAYL